LRWQKHTIHHAEVVWVVRAELAQQSWHGWPMDRTAIRKWISNVSPEQQWQISPQQSTRSLLLRQSRRSFGRMDKQWTKLSSNDAQKHARTNGNGNTLHCASAKAIPTWMEWKSSKTMGLCTVNEP
jgi:hypothetical protein